MLYMDKVVWILWIIFSYLDDLKKKKKKKKNILSKNAKYQW